MPSNSAIRYYPRADFLALSGDIPIALLRTALNAVPQTVTIIDVRLSPQQDAAVVEWLAFPSQQDIADLDAAIAAFAGGATTSQPFEFNDFGASTSSNSTPVNKIDVTTPPLDPGTYQVIWTSSLRMATAAANAGVQGKIHLERSDGAVVEQTDAWDLNVAHAFNGRARRRRCAPCRRSSSSTAPSRSSSGCTAERSAAPRSGR